MYIIYIYIYHTVPGEATSHKIHFQKSHIILSFTIYCPFLNANKHEYQIDLQLYRLWFLAHTEYLITSHLYWSGFSVLRSFPSQTGVTYLHSNINCACQKKKKTLFGLYHVWTEKHEVVSHIKASSSLIQHRAFKQTRWLSEVTTSYPKICIYRLSTHHRSIW